MRILTALELSKLACLLVRNNEKKGYGLGIYRLGKRQNFGNGKIVTKTSENFYKGKNEKSRMMRTGGFKDSEMRNRYQIGLVGKDAGADVMKIEEINDRRKYLKFCFENLEILCRNLRTGVKLSVNRVVTTQNLNMDNIQKLVKKSQLRVKSSYWRLTHSTLGQRKSVRVIDSLNKSRI